MINLLSPKTTIVDTAWLFAKSLDVNISYSTLKNEIEEHPFYPSLLSISEVLSSFGIKNMTVKFEVNKIPDISTPLLIQIKGENIRDNFFSIVRKITATDVKYYEPQSKKWKIENRDTFIGRCTGIVLMTDVDNNAGETDCQQKVQKERKSLYFQYFAITILPTILVLQGLLGYFAHSSSVFTGLIFSFLYLIGGLISTLLIMNDVGHYSPVVQAICGLGKKVNCDAILSSAGAKVFGISWSIIGFTYFVGGFIYTLIVGFDSITPLVTLWQLNLLGSLYVFYSIYYQWKIAKNWCPLCLAIQGSLLLITLCGFLGKWYNYLNFSPDNTIRLLTTFSIPFLSSVSFYSIVLKAKEYRNGKLEFQRLKRNPDFLRRNLTEQKQITESLDGLGILLGNPSARNKLVKVCNPYCNPCSLVHDFVEKLITSSDDLCVQIIFTATNDINDKRSFPIKHFLAIYASGKYNITDALNDWHRSERKDYEVFASKYPINSALLESQSVNIEAMRIWCEKLSIAFTPTFFVNGYQLPSMYSIHDLKYYFID